MAVLSLKTMKLAANRAVRLKITMAFPMTVDMAVLSLKMMKLAAMIQMVMALKRALKRAINGDRTRIARHQRMRVMLSQGHIDRRRTDRRDTPHHGVVQANTRGKSMSMVSSSTINIRTIQIPADLDLVAAAASIPVNTLASIPVNILANIPAIILRM